MARGRRGGSRQLRRFCGGAGRRWNRAVAGEVIGVGCRGWAARVPGKGFGGEAVESVLGIGAAGGRTPHGNGARGDAADGVAGIAEPGDLRAAGGSVDNVRHAVHEIVGVLRHEAAGVGHGLDKTVQVAVGEAEGGGRSRDARESVGGVVGVGDDARGSPGGLAPPMATAAGRPSLR